jgi:hypothetical protein
MREISTIECIFVSASMLCSMLYYEINHKEGELTNGDILLIKFTLSLCSICTFLSSNLIIIKYMLSNSMCIPIYCET